MYDAGNYCSVFDTLDDRDGENALAIRSDWIRILCSHAGSMYDAGNYCKIFDTMNHRRGKPPVATRPGWVYALCSYRGRLLDGGCYNSIYDTLENNKIYSCDEHITAMCSHKWGT